MNNGIGEGLEIYDKETVAAKLVDERVILSGGKIMDVPIAPAQISQFSGLEQFFANLITGEVGRQIGECMTLVKEQLSDVIGTQLDALKAGEVADAVKAAVETAVADGKRVANMDSFKEVQQKYNIGRKHNEINELIECIEEIRGDILTQNKTLRTVRQSLYDAEFAMKEAETNLLADIAAEVIQGTDKAKFSNDKARQAELAARKKTDPDYLAAVEAYKNIKVQYEGVEDEISDLTILKKKYKAQFEAECRTLEAMTAEMNIYAAALGAGAYSGAGNMFERQDTPGVDYLSPNAIHSPKNSPQENDNSEMKGW